MIDETKLVSFDLFGTIIRFGVMHHPYRKILKWARENGRKPSHDDARMIMTINADPELVFARMKIFPPHDLLIHFNQEIQEELDSLVLFEDALPVMNVLKQRGIQIAICSNLAAPYGPAIERLLPQHELIKCLSYEVGHIKPESEIYAEIVNKSGVQAADILFVGDTFIADFVGPSTYGFRALHLDRGTNTADSAIRTLAEILS